MQKTVTEMIEHLSYSNYQIARVLEAKRHVTVRLSENVQALPDVDPLFDGMPGLIDNSQALTQSIVAYLNSFADLQETMAAQLTFVIRELKEADEEE